MATRCGCGNSTCNCLLEAGEGIELAGTGTQTDPYIISATGGGEATTVSDTGSLNLTLAGADISGVVVPSADADNAVVLGTDGGVFAPASTEAFPFGGDGSDGVGTFDGVATPAGVTKAGAVYTATRDLYYTDATLSGGSELRMAGFRLFARGTLTVEAGTSIRRDGANAVSNTPGVALSGGTIAHVSGAGGAGVTFTGNGAAGTNVSTALGGAGGIGGAGGGGSGAGSGGASAAPSAATGLPRNPPSAITARSFTTMSNLGIYSAGAGGGGGANNGGSSISGGGGGGGGTLVVSAFRIVNQGLISARGGQGGNASTTGGGNAGGGGGGGGGAVLVVSTSAVNGTVDVDGGAGGSGVGVSAAGVNGSVGAVYWIEV